MALSAARTPPSSIFRATPSPRSGKAAQYTPSAPTFTKARPPRTSISRVSNRPVPATMKGWAATAPRMRAAAWAVPRSRPSPEPNRAKPRASAASGTA
jgi:hypothetical protein